MQVTDVAGSKRRPTIFALLNISACGKKIF
jgi:hypothetical protein